MAIIIPFPGATSVNASRAERLFRELDCRAIGDGASRWIAQVYSVHSENSEEWVQVAPVGEPSRSVVLRFSPQAGPAQAVAALKTWTRLPERVRPAIVDVASVNGGPFAAA